MKIVSTNEMLEVDRITTEKTGIPEVLLMENAAAVVSAHCAAYLQNIPHPKAMIVSGKGFKGGVALAAARHLAMKLIDVGVIFVGNETDALNNTRLHLNIIKSLKIPVQFMPVASALPGIPCAIEPYDLIVDGMLDWRLRANPDDTQTYMIEMINRYSRHVIAIDAPSGIGPDDGRIQKTAVRADKTIALGFGKIGLYVNDGVKYAGALEVADIGLPPLIENEVDIHTQVLDDRLAQKMLPNRPRYANKGTFGKTYIFAGCDDMPGAATFAANAVYKGGGGLVRACVTRHVADVIHNRVPEAVTTILPDDNGFLCPESFEAIKARLGEADVIILGPGLGNHASVKPFVMRMIQHTDTYMVIDADALNAIAGNTDVLKALTGKAVVTPHPGEMNRLTDIPVDDILANMVEVAKNFAKKHQVFTVLKSARTVIASPSGDVCINTSGTPAMAKAGSGDVLAGLIAAMIAQGKAPFDACMLSAYIHGKAGEEAARKRSVYGVTATDLLEFIPSFMTNLESIQSTRNI